MGITFLQIERAVAVYWGQYLRKDGERPADLDALRGMVSEALELPAANVDTFLLEALMAGPGPEPVE